MRRVWSTKWRSASKTSPGKLYTSRLTGLASVSLAAVAIAIAPEQFTKHISSFLSKKQTNRPVYIQIYRCYAPGVAWESMRWPADLALR